MCGHTHPDSKIKYFVFYNVYDAFVYYTVCYFTGIFYAVVKQISMVFIDNKDSVFCQQTPLAPFFIVWNENAPGEFPLQIDFAFAELRVSVHKHRGHFNCIAQRKCCSSNRLPQPYNTVIDS